MTKRHGLNKYEDKERRKMRRQHNHIARDLRSPKFRQQRVESQKNKKDKHNWKKEIYDDNED